MEPQGISRDPPRCHAIEDSEPQMNMRNALPRADLLEHSNLDATYFKIRAGAPEPQSYPKWMLGHRHRRSRPIVLKNSASEREMANWQKVFPPIWHSENFVFWGAT